VSATLIPPTQLPLSKAWATVHHLMVLLGIFFMRFGANSEIVLSSIYLTRTGWIDHYQQLIPWPPWIKLGHCTALEWVNLPMVTKHQFSPTKATICEETSPGPQGYEYQESKTPTFGVTDSTCSQETRQLPPFAFSCAVHRKPSISVQSIENLPSLVDGSNHQFWEIHCNHETGGDSSQHYPHCNKTTNTVHERRFPV
jgi:hypothetical protein